MTPKMGGFFPKAVRITSMADNSMMLRRSEIALGISFPNIEDRHAAIPEAYKSAITGLFSFVHSTPNPALSNPMSRKPPPVKKDKIGICCFNTPPSVARADRAALSFNVESGHRGRQSIQILDSCAHNALADRQEFGHAELFEKSDARRTCESPLGGESAPPPRRLEVPALSHRKIESPPGR
jgi:hypothetical protein